MTPRTSPYSICSRCLARRQISTSVRRPNQSASASTQPPRAGAAKLVNRRMIALHGHDASHFLQGLTTNNIRPGQTTGLYSAFLNAQGRVLNDVFIYPTTDTHSFFPSSTAPEDPTFLIEADTDQVHKLLQHLNRYRLRAKVSTRLVPEDERSVWSVWNDGNWTAHQAATLPGASVADGGAETSGILGCADTRAPNMGRRIILPPGETPQANEEGEAVQEVGLHAYTIRRMLKGVPEGQSEIFREAALPLESNIDYMGGIDFRKGCYVGQELTIRTHHTGVVRKRILPVQLYAQPQHPNERAPKKLSFDDGPHAEEQWSATGLIPSSTTIFRLGDERKTSAGRWIKGVGNVGLALCRLQVMTNMKLPSTPPSSSWRPENEYGMEWRGMDFEMTPVTKVKAFMPNWHPRDENKQD
ncbi:MAG: hypothetical protein M4579_002677 [Chaenotheca gracillima]|nr:MAG: hypothetical protein M4579_002677 [Chaenotheca gracillima]